MRGLSGDKNRGVKSIMGSNNGGFSLIELIAGIAILAVLSAGIVMGSGIAGRARQRQCLEEIKSALDTTKVNAMTREGCVLQILVDADGGYVLEVTGEGQTKLAASGMTISYIRSDTGEACRVSKEAPLSLSFDRGSGAFLPMITGSAGEWYDTAGQYTYLTGASGSYVYCSCIRVDMGERAVDLVLVTDTGRYYED